MDLAATRINGVNGEWSMVNIKFVHVILLTTDDSPLTIEASLTLFNFTV